MSRAAAPAKLNLALVVGPRRDDGKHEVLTLIAPLALADEIELEQADDVTVAGYEGDTLVRGALEALASAAGTDPCWRVRIEKRIPVAAGLGGGSSDAGTALRLANQTLDQPLPDGRLHELAAGLGADVPFFLEPGPKVARGDGTTLAPLALAPDFVVVVLLPEGVSKNSTADVYRAFDLRRGERGFDERAALLEDALGRGDLEKLPRNDLASSPHTKRLEQLGAFRADVTGAGPAVYGLFRKRSVAEDAALALGALGRVWVSKPGW